MTKKEGILIPTTRISSTGELVLTWDELKNFYTEVGGGNRSYINYVEFSEHYYVWLTFRDQKLYIPHLGKNTTEGTDFETNFKSKCNIPEAPRTRITTNQLGRKLHSRFITFMTSSKDNYDNTDWRDNPYGDLTYTMFDPEGNVTLNDSECKETWIDWMPDYDYEVAGGSLFIPPELANRVISVDNISVTGSEALVSSTGHGLRAKGMITISGADQPEYNGVKKVSEVIDEDTFKYPITGSPEDATGTIQLEEGDDAWEIHAVGVPDFPAAYGGDVHFIANPRIKWMKNSHLYIDANLNPAELKYGGVMPTNKIRFVVKHPLGAQTEFQLNLKVYK